MHSLYPTVSSHSCQTPCNWGPVSLWGSIAQSSGSPNPETTRIWGGTFGVRSWDLSRHHPSSVGSDTSSPSHSITVKDLKAMLPQVNYRVPNMRFLRDKLVVRTP